MITIKKHQVVYIIIAEMNQLYIVDFTNDDATHSFKFKEKITCQRTNVGANNSPIKISKYFFWSPSIVVN